MTLGNNKAGTDKDSDAGGSRTEGNAFRAGKWVLRLLLGACCISIVAFWLGGFPAGVSLLERLSVLIKEQPLLAQMVASALTSVVVAGVFLVYQCVLDEGEGRKLMKQLTDHEKKCFANRGERFDRVSCQISYVGERDKANIRMLWSDRDSPEAQFAVLDAIRDTIEKNKEKPGTVRILGTSLRALTMKGGLYYPKTDKVIELFNKYSTADIDVFLKALKPEYAQLEGSNYVNLLVRLLADTKLRLELAVLNPFCFEAFLRSQSERQFGRDHEETEPRDTRFESLDQYSDESGFFHDFVGTKNFVQGIVALEEGVPEEKKRVHFRLCSSGNLFLMILPACCFKEQKVFESAPALSDAAEIAFIQYAREKATSDKQDTPAYVKLANHFDFVWKTSLSLTDSPEKFAEALNGGGEMAQKAFDLYRSLVPR